MTEKEKMLSGEMYDSSDKELKEERQRARRLCYKYNIELHPDDKERFKRSGMLFLASMKGRKT